MIQAVLKREDMPASASPVDIEATGNNFEDETDLESVSRGRIWLSVELTNKNKPGAPPLDEKARLYTLVPNGSQALGDWAACPRILFGEGEGGSREDGGLIWWRRGWQPG